MEIRTLRYFLAVAREENMTEAANVLHVTQPTLSRQIADLERELGCTLFDRTNRATTLTEEGMHLRQRAEEIVSLADQTRDEMRGDMTELNGCIRIGAAQTRSMSVVASVFAEMRREHPGVTIELFSGNADAVEDRLEHGLLDFAVMLDPVRLTKYEHLELPKRTRDRVGVLVGAHGKWADRADHKAITPADLMNMPLLISSRTSHESFDLAAWSGGMIDVDELDIVGRFDLIGNAALLVQAGVANALSIDHLLKPDAEVAFVPLDPPLTIGCYVVWKRYRLLSRTCEEFLRRLRAVCDSADAGM